MVQWVIDGPSPALRRGGSSASVAGSSASTPLGFNEQRSGATSVTSVADDPYATATREAMHIRKLVESFRVVHTCIDRVKDLLSHDAFAKADMRQLEMVATQPVPENTITHQERLDMFTGLIDWFASAAFDVAEHSRKYHKIAVNEASIFRSKQACRLGRSLHDIRALLSKTEEVCV